MRADTRRAHLAVAAGDRKRNPSTSQHSASSLEGALMSFQEVVHSDPTEETGVTTLQIRPEGPNDDCCLSFKLSWRSDQRDSQKGTHALLLLWPLLGCKR